MLHAILSIFIFCVKIKVSFKLTTTWTSTNYFIVFGNTYIMYCSLATDQDLEEMAAEELWVFQKKHHHL